MVGNDELNKGFIDDQEQIEILEEEEEEFEEPKVSS